MFITSKNIILPFKTVGTIVRVILMNFNVTVSVSLVHPPGEPLRVSDKEDWREIPLDGVDMIMASKCWLATGVHHQREVELHEVVHPEDPPGFTNQDCISGQPVLMLLQLREVTHQPAPLNLVREGYQVHEIMWIVPHCEALCRGMVPGQDQGAGGSLI